VRLGSRTYLIASSRLITPVDHWTLGGIAHPLENCCLPCVGSSNNEDPELDIAGELGEILLRIHGPKVCTLNMEAGRLVGGRTRARVLEHSITLLSATTIHGTRYKSADHLRSFDDTVT
jgi:hypothetical protein